MHANGSKYTHADVEDIDIDKNGPPEHLWSNIASSTEESRIHTVQEGSEQLAELSQDDSQSSEDILTAATANLHVIFESATNQQ